MTAENRTHRRRWIAAAAAAVAVAGGAVVVVSSAGSTSTPAPATSGPVATIANRDLVQTDDQPGTLGHTDTRNVYNQLSGTVTWVPDAGAVVRQGGLLYRVDGNGVYLFYGRQPIYRPFTSGMSDGRDVGELNRDLHAMGYDAGEAVDLGNVDHFQPATGHAIDRWQKAHGLEQTGALDLGRVAFLPGARRIETVELSVGGPATSSAMGAGASGPTASVGADSTGSSGGSNGTGASYDQRSGAGRTVEASFVRITDAATTATTTTPSTATAPATTTPASAPTAARVPNVTGDRASAAGSALIAARFTVAEKTKPVTDKRESGVVLDQHPAGGSIAGEGSAVTLTVGRYDAGPRTTPGTRPTHPRPEHAGAVGAADTWAMGAAAAGAARSSGAAASDGGASASSGAVASGAGGAGTSGAGASSGGVSSLPPNLALVTTSTEMVATVQLDASRQTEAVVGESVYVTLPSNAVAEGVITQVGRVAQTSSQPSGGGSSSGSGGNSTGGAGSAPQATIPVTISLGHTAGLGSLDQAPVTVAFALTTTRNALSIPVSALLATAGGGYAVDVVGPSGTVTRKPVTPGSFAGGYVQISGPGIAAGMHVRDTTGG